jgi:hypothetical protein
MIVQAPKYVNGLLWLGYANKQLTQPGIEPSWACPKFLGKDWTSLETSVLLRRYRPLEDRASLVLLKLA